MTTSAAIILVPSVPPVLILVLPQILNAILLLPLRAFMYGIARNPALVVAIAFSAECVASLAILSP